MRIGHPQCGATCGSMAETFSHELQCPECQAIYKREREMFQAQVYTYLQELRRFEQESRKVEITVGSRIGDYT